MSVTMHMKNFVEHKKRGNYEWIAARRVDVIKIPESFFLFYVNFLLLFFYGTISCETFKGEQNSSLFLLIFTILNFSLIFYVFSSTSFSFCFFLLFETFVFFFTNFPPKNQLKSFLCLFTVLESFLAHCRLDYNFWFALINFSFTLCFAKVEKISHTSHPTSASSEISI